MKQIDTIREGFVNNPVAWILCALLGVAEYGNHQRGRDLDRVCELLGAHDVAVRSPRTERKKSTTYVSAELRLTSSDFP